MQALRVVERRRASAPTTALWIVYRDLFPYFGAKASFSVSGSKPGVAFPLLAWR